MAGCSTSSSRAAGLGTLSHPFNIADPALATFVEVAPQSAAGQALRKQWPALIASAPPVCMFIRPRMTGSAPHEWFASQPQPPHGGARLDTVELVHAKSGEAAVVELLTLRKADGQTVVDPLTQLQQEAVPERMLRLCERFRLPT
jgi:hypothetical protein